MRRGLRRPAAVVAVVLATAATLLAAPSSRAIAHDYLVSSSPAANSTVTTPVSRVSLTFDAVVLSYGRASTAVLVTGPGKGTRHFETSCAAIDGATVSASTALGGSGTYTVTWRVVSADGHPVSDSLRFTYRRPAGTRAAPGTPHGPSCGLGSGASPATPADRGTVDPVVWLAIGIGGALLVLAGAAVAVAVLDLRRRGRPVKRP